MAWVLQKFRSYCDINAESDHTLVWSKLCLCLGDRRRARHINQCIKTNITSYNGGVHWIAVCSSNFLTTGVCLGSLVWIGKVKFRHLVECLWYCFWIPKILSLNHFVSDGIKGKTPNGASYSAKRWIRLKLKESFQNDPQAWWIKHSNKMDVAWATGNSCQLFRSIRLSGKCRNRVSEHLKKIGRYSLIENNQFPK